MHREWGYDIFTTIEKRCKTRYGYGSYPDVTKENQTPEDRMETFFPAETLKYLYLLFSSEQNIDFNKVVFNTECHPLPILQLVHIIVMPKFVRILYNNTPTQVDVTPNMRFVDCISDFFQVLNSCPSDIQKQTRLTNDNLWTLSYKNRELPAQDLVSSLGDAPFYDLLITHSKEKAIEDNTGGRPTSSSVPFSSELTSGDPSMIKVVTLNDIYLQLHLLSPLTQVCYFQLAYPESTIESVVNNLKVLFFVLFSCRLYYQQEKK